MLTALSIERPRSFLAGTHPSLRSDLDRVRCALDQDELMPGNAFSCGHRLVHCMAPRLSDMVHDMHGGGEPGAG